MWSYGLVASLPFRLRRITQVNARIRHSVIESWVPFRSRRGPSTCTLTLLGADGVAQDLFERDQAFEGLISTDDNYFVCALVAECQRRVVPGLFPVAPGPEHIAEDA